MKWMNHLSLLFQPTNKWMDHHQQKVGVFTLLKCISDLPALIPLSKLFLESEIRYLCYSLYWNPIYPSKPDSKSTESSKTSLITKDRSGLFSSESNCVLVCTMLMKCIWHILIDSIFLYILYFQKLVILSHFLEEGGIYRNTKLKKTETSSTIYWNASFKKYLKLLFCMHLLRYSLCTLNGRNSISIYSLWISSSFLMPISYKLETPK